LTISNHHAPAEAFVPARDLAGGLQNKGFESENRLQK